MRGGRRKDILWRALTVIYAPDVAQPLRRSAGTMVPWNLGYGRNRKLEDASRVNPVDASTAEKPL